MKLEPVMKVAAVTALPASLAARDKGRDGSRDQLHDRERLSVTDCAAPIRARDELEACAADRNHDRHRDCNPSTH